MGKRALATAVSAAAVLNGDMVSLIKTRGDESRPEYATLIDQLKRIRDANRASGLPIGFLYTMHLSPGDPTVLLYGLDPEEKFNLKSFPGDVVHGMKANDIPFNRPHIHPEFRTDSWGTWLIARHPIKDSKGNIVAILGADINKDVVMQETHTVTSRRLIGIGIQCIIALIGALLIARTASIPLKKILLGIEEINAEKFPIKIGVTTTDEFGKVARSLEDMSVGLVERNLVKSAFARYVSQQVADSILSNGTHPQLHGERRRITVLFCDVRGFTTISEKLTPEQVVNLLNSYFEKMVDVIFKHHGTLDKFLGDGLMAVFGAPVEDQFQEENALKAAMEMRSELMKLNDQVKESHGLELAIGIGINSGTAIVGNIGSSQRMEYTAIGDTVNLASRLEAKTKEVGADILISEYTYNSIRGAFPFQFQRVGTIAVKGRVDEVTAYSVPHVSA